MCIIQFRERKKSGNVKWVFQQCSSRIQANNSKSRMSLDVAVSCGYGTCFVVKTCDGLYHFIFSIDHVGIPFGFQHIVWTFVRHTASRCLIFPVLRVMLSGLYSEIDKIHLSIEAQCVTTLLPQGDCHTRSNESLTLWICQAFVFVSCLLSPKHDQSGDFWAYDRGTVAIETDQYNSMRWDVFQFHYRS